MDIEISAATHIGGSARGYYQLFTWLAVRKSEFRPPSDRRPDRIFYALPRFGVNFLICRGQVERYGRSRETSAVVTCSPDSYDFCQPGCGLTGNVLRRAT
jgi:hypothetical protein